MSIALTVFFEDPFYVALVERREGGRLSAARYVFGAEPSDAQVAQWVMEGLSGLQFSPGVAAGRKPQLAGNPKRRQRQAAQDAQPAKSTRSQQALSLLREQNAAARAARSRAQREEEAQRQFLLKQQKKKAKHRGR